VVLESTRPIDIDPTYRYVYKTHKLHTLLQSEREHSLIHCMCRVFVLFAKVPEREAQSRHWRYKAINNFGLQPYSSSRRGVQLILQ